MTIVIDSFVGVKYFTPTFTLLIGVKLSHFLFKDIDNKIYTTCSVRDDHTWEMGNFQMEVCVDIAMR